MCPSLHLSCSWTKGVQRCLSISLVPNWQEQVGKGARAQKSHVDTARCHRARSPGQGWASSSGWVLVRALDSLFQQRYDFCINSPLSVRQEWLSAPKQQSIVWSIFICNAILVLTRRTKHYFHRKPWCAGVSYWDLQLEFAWTMHSPWRSVPVVCLHSASLFPKPVPIFPLWRSILLNPIE